MTEHTERAREIVEMLYPSISPTYDPVYRQTVVSVDDLQAAITAALTAVEREAIERCAGIAKEYADSAKDDIGESDEWPNSYGSGYDTGEYQAAKNILAEIRALVKEGE